MNYTTGSIDGGVDGSTIPFADSLYDVGSSSKRYRNGHFVDVYLGSGSVDLTTSIANDISAASAAILATKGQTEGICPLSGGLIPSGHIPPLAITSATVYANSAARDADSSVLEGDVAIVTDVQKSYIFDGSVYVELLTTGSIATINGKTGGVVTLNTAEVPESGDARYYTAARAAGPMAVSSVSTTGIVAVGGSLNVNSHAAVGGNLGVVGTLAATTVTMSGNCAVVGSITGADLTTIGNCAVGGSITGSDLSTTGNVAVGGILSGATVSATDVYVSNNASCNGTVTCGALDVVSGGTSNFSGPVVGLGTLGFYGPTNVFQNLVSLPGTTTSNILDVTTLSVAGNATVSGDLTVTGDSVHSVPWYTGYMTVGGQVTTFGSINTFPSFNVGNSFAFDSSSEFTGITNGSITYVGRKRRMQLIYTFSWSCSVANTNVMFIITNNGAVLSGPEIVSTSSSTAGSDVSLTIPFVMEVDSGDVISVKVSNRSGTASITARNVIYTCVALPTYIP
jgi:hypothetical protein